MKTGPYAGLNKSRPITYSNINSMMHPVVMQAKTLECQYHDGDKSFSLKDSNAYYNPAMRVNGALTE